jgi:hypothetical protein
VTDATLPTITCPANITAAGGASCTASVVTPAPTTSDNCGITVRTWAMTGATIATSAATGINSVGTYTFNGGVFKLYNLKDVININYFISYLKSAEFINNLKSIKSGSVGMFTINGLKNIQIPVPSLEIQLNLMNKINSLNDLLTYHYTYAKTLQTEIDLIIETIQNITTDTTDTTDTSDNRIQTNYQNKMSEDKVKQLLKFFNIDGNEITVDVDKLDNIHKYYEDINDLQILDTLIDKYKTGIKNWVYKYKSHIDICINFDSNKLDSIMNIVLKNNMII